ncbi:class I adenylate-forming enzyme family protein [Planosporangium mesophilum]|uniref:Long-chain acyl-CoA synthetase n=1 Tax=Planosporangium mesophilum TaxID=689768 RepID=A0A8J3TFC9_9ACTN|nr:AMP-binding protein [Planosporangium mesophilum]NJC86691.1 long-chain fatty acid--CoA ligase [Planosporangium mesophilum]GII24117.1 long-chain acyl-CoA synthetase [Planosporangium mesophilum]
MTATEPAPAVASWPPGLPRSLEYPRVPGGSILRAAVRRWGERTAFVHHDVPLTFTELGRRAHAVANWLADHGIGRGDVVAIHLPNCRQYPAVYYGVLLCGATFSPTNPLLPPAELAAQLADAGARVLVTWEQVLPVVRAALPATKVTTVVVTGPAHVADFAARLDLGAGEVDLAELLAADDTDRRLDAGVDVDADLAHLAYTGGTTGVSKGVELPHRAVVTNVLQSACWTSGSLPTVDGAGDVTLRQVGSEEEYPTRLGTATIINLTPWFHAMGAIGYLNGQVMGGTTVVIHDRFDPAAYLTDAVRHRVTGIGGAPPVFVALLQVPGIESADLSSVRGISSGAAPLPVPLIERLRRLFPNAPIGEGYGLTEVTMMATGNPSFRSGTRKPGTVGVPIFDTEISIQPLGGGAPLPPGERGEVCIRGPQVMRGYAHRPEATAEAIDADGWFHSGDVGTLDEDGYLSIVDRTKDMLLYKGYNVFPRELEEILFSLPGVAGAAVVGRPDEGAGELPVAYIVRTGDDDGAALTAESLMAAVNERVVPYKRVRDVVFVDAIPVSAAGKVLKRELAARERATAAGTP